MKLITENATLLAGHHEDELNEASGRTERNYYISGIFSTPEAKNRNGRVYSRAIWEREVERYQKEITERSVNTLGEWQHPPRSTIDPSKAVLRIVELKMDDVGNVVGKAKIINDDTDLTNKLKGLIKEGIKIGVSSRGVGSVSATGVVEDFKLITYDAVDMPSDYNAMLNGVVEGVQFIDGIAQDKEYQIDENGCIGEVCNITNPSLNENNKTDEKCPIKKKIEEETKILKEEFQKELSDLKEELVENISDYLEKANETNNEKREELVENISDYMDMINNTQKEVNETDEDIAKKLIEALNKNNIVESKYDNLKTSDALLKLININKKDKIGKDTITPNEAKGLLAFYDMLDDSNQKNFDNSSIKEIKNMIKKL